MLAYKHTLQTTTHTSRNELREWLVCLQCVDRSVFANDGLSIVCSGLLLSLFLCFRHFFLFRFPHATLPNTSIFVNTKLQFKKDTMLQCDNFLSSSFLIFRDFLSFFPFFYYFFPNLYPSTRLHLLNYFSL